MATTPLPEPDVARVKQWCAKQVPEHLLDQLRVDCDVTDRHITIVECRPPFRPELESEWMRTPIGQFRFTKATRLWSLYWADRDDNWLPYPDFAPSRSIQDLIDEVTEDPMSLFWG